MNCIIVLSIIVLSFVACTGMVKAAWGVVPGVKAPVASTFNIHVNEKQSLESIGMSSKLLRQAAN